MAPNGDVLYELEPILAIGGHTIERTLRVYEVDGLPSKRGRARCILCKRTLIFPFETNDPTVPDVEERTFREAMRLHSCGCAAVLFTNA